MKKLCFGSFASVLILCKAKGVTQKKLCGTLLLSVAPNYDICDDDGTTSDLVLGKKNLSSNVTDAAPTADFINVTEHFKSNVIPLLNANSLQLITLALKDLIASDNVINESTIIDEQNHLTKAKIIAQDSFVLADFLAGVFLYVVKNVENRDCEKYVKEITEDYIQSFSSQKSNVFLLNEYPKLPVEITDELINDVRIQALFTITEGKCQRCGHPLSINKNGNAVSYAKIVKLSEHEETLLCVTCEREIQSNLEESKTSLLMEKYELEKIATASLAISRTEINRQIAEVLQNVSSMQASDATTLKYEPVRVSKKINLLPLRRKALSYVLGYYDDIREKLDQLSGENALNIDRFAKKIRRMFEDAEETIADQSDIFNLLVDKLYIENKRKYREACEIIISYFIQRCEVFDEIAE